MSKRSRMMQEKKSIVYLFNRSQLMSTCKELNDIWKDIFVQKMREYGFAFPERRTTYESVVAIIYGIGDIASKVPANLRYLAKPGCLIFMFTCQYFDPVSMAEYFEACTGTLDVTIVRTRLRLDFHYLLSIRADAAVRADLMAKANQLYKEISLIMSNTVSNLAAGLLTRVCDLACSLSPAYLLIEKNWFTSLLADLWIVAPVIVLNPVHVYYRICKFYNFISMCNPDIDPSTPVGLCVYTSFFTPTHLMIMTWSMRKSMMESKAMQIF